MTVSARRMSSDQRGAKIDDWEARTSTGQVMSSPAATWEWPASTAASQPGRIGALGLVQLLILYHVVTARAVVALGGESVRPFQLPTGDELVNEIFGEESAAL